MHKYLVQRLLANPNGERDRFIAKIGKHDAAYDTEDTGGIELEDNSAKEFPALPSANPGTDDVDRLSSVLGGITLSSIEGGVNIPGMPSIEAGQSRAWASTGDGRDSASVLFPNAQPNPTPNGRYGNALDTDDEGINIFKTRFWDPTSADYKAERFFDPVAGQYHCPFICE